MKTWIAIIVAITCLFVPNAVYAKEESYILDTTKVSQGYIVVKTNVKTEKKQKVFVETKDDWYSYLIQSGKTENLPLQMGDGEYTIRFYEQKSGKAYVKKLEKTISIKLKNPNSVYLATVQNVKWTIGDAASTKALAIIKNKKTQLDRVKAIHAYIITTYKYDYNLAKNVSNDYLPDNAKMMRAKRGICYDYASLFASMLRSIGIPSKLVMGYTSYMETYHAWNEVYIDGKWQTVDPTYDAAKKSTLFKDAKTYKTLKVY
jgi:transglutaminase-like putative cysteine protease